MVCKDINDSEESSIYLNENESVDGNVFLLVAAENPATWLFCLSCTLVMILIKQNNISDFSYPIYLISRVKFI